MFDNLEDINDYPLTNFLYPGYHAVENYLNSINCGCHNNLGSKENEKDVDGKICGKTTNQTQLPELCDAEMQYEKRFKDKSLFYFTSFEEIKSILKNNEKLYKISEKIKKFNKIQKAENKLSKYKRKQNDNTFILDIKEENSIEEINGVKRGRKPNTYETKIEHTKLSPDNIIRKIKVYIFNYCLKFLNNILGQDNKSNLYKLDHKYIQQLKKKIDLDFLKNSLKELFSKDLSTKYKNVPKDMNKILIKKIINREIYVEDYETVMFVFNMTLTEWISLFTYKKTIIEVMNNNKLENNINIKKIEKSLIRADEILNKISKKNDVKFLSFFTFYLYNYECWFFTKTERVLLNQKEI